MKSPRFLRGRLYAATARPKVSANSLAILRRKHPAGCVAAASLLIIAALSGCSTQPPVVQIERVNVPQYLPIPSTLVAPISANLKPGITWGDAVGTLYTGLKTCNADKASIATLKAPPPIKP